MRCDVCHFGSLFDEKIIELKCNHVIHIGCYYNEDKSICPVCGYDINEINSCILCFYKSQQCVAKYQIVLISILTILFLTSFILIIIFDAYDEYNDIDRSNDIKMFVIVILIVSISLIMSIILIYPMICNRKN